MDLFPTTPGWYIIGGCDGGRGVGDRGRAVAAGVFFTRFWVWRGLSLSTEQPAFARVTLARFPLAVARALVAALLLPVTRDLVGVVVPPGGAGALGNNDPVGYITCPCTSSG
jgi:hypothetical protein